MRKMLALPERVHAQLKSLADDKGLPMSVLVENLVGHSELIPWEDIQRSYELAKPTWANIRRIVQEYQVKFPQASDGELVDMTGFTLAQVETVTHSAHKRCIAYMKKYPKRDFTRVAKDCSVSNNFAGRIYEQFHNGAKIPKRERYLFEGVKHANLNS